ncbi:ATP-grasp fold amidoligase family protein [Shimia sp. FJ5]|uniref:ATP-grasp fold amidoligase family protein n=1 Tax=Shimia sp. FJ5 TaxID=3079054 RepID=UPI002612C17B|nr:ATP-grasp fold amidoligase family protein [Shimia sp. FJ5]MDV4146047.1 hypothetical protein [Shimia sp. FJ5]
MTTCLPSDTAFHALVDGVARRKALAEKQARSLPRTARQAFLYDATFQNEIEAVAYPLALAIGRVPNFATPTTYCEKMRSLYLIHPNPLMSLVADKVEMHRYCDLMDAPIRPPKLYAAFDDPSELDLSDLPQTAMLKISDGCKMNILHGPGMPVTPFALRRFLNRYWHVDHWRRHAELHYRDIPRRLLVEEALLPIESLTETCVFCAFGTPYMSLNKTGYSADVHAGRNGGYIALEERLKPLERYADFVTPPYEVAWPERHRAAMLETARRLSAPLPNCRIDFMFIDNRCYLGEITISSAAFTKPYDSLDQEILLGSLYDLTRLPDFLEKGRAIAHSLGWPVDTSFGHIAPDDPRLLTGGQ